MAANNEIVIQKTQSAAINAAELLQYVAIVRQAYELGTRIRAKMRHCFDDSGGAGSINWGTVETLWGIPAGNTSVGPTANGSIVFTFVDGTTGSLDGSFQSNAGETMTETVMG